MQDRVYCTDNRKPLIYTASMGLFRDHIIRASLDPNDSDSFKVVSLLNGIILDQIQMEREGDIIDRNLIRSCVYMLEGLYETDDEDENEKLYLTSFEPAYLGASRAHYQSEAERTLRQADAASFLRHTQKRLDEEHERCHSTLSHLTAPKIQKVIEDEVVRKHIAEVVEMEASGARHMFDNDRFDDLRLMYELVGRVDSKKATLSKALRTRIVELGTDINNASAAATASPGDASSAGDKDATDPASKASAHSSANLQTAAAIQWVDDVLRLKDKYELIWNRSFDRDHELQTSLTRGFTTFIDNFKRSAEYISLFIDDNLRRGLKGKTEAEADEVLEKAVVLLRYLQDKDMFERYYKKHLSKRLLGGRSVSNEVERQMISKMKMEIGNYFTQKLEGMFKDMAVSEGLTTDFRAHVSRLHEERGRRAELDVNILTSTFWPMDVLGYATEEEANRSTCVFPPEIRRVKDSFENFYLGRHNGRRLTWQPNAGSADIRVVFPAVPGKGAPLNKERKHELNVSTYAMVILLLFNDLASGESLTFEEIQAKTMIPTSELTRNLQSLAVAPKTRILVKEPMSKDIKSTDRFLFNESFTSKFLKIKVGVVAGTNKVEGERERKDTEKRNDEMRGGIIEAAIVRIMKYVSNARVPPLSSHVPCPMSYLPLTHRGLRGDVLTERRGRKHLSHQNLCSELISQLANRFNPDMSMVKKRIESLIEREYLERVGNTQRTEYRYLA